LSHYTKLVTKIKNRNSLVKALQRAGFKQDQIEIHDNAQHLYGYHGDERPETANVILRRKHIGSASNDIGFKLNKNGTYEAIISDYDKHTYNDQWMKDLTTNYGIEQAKDAFMQHGWEVTEKHDQQGRIQLVGVTY
jgi:hypothetical protein